MRCCWSFPAHFILCSNNKFGLSRHVSRGLLIRSACDEEPAQFRIIVCLFLFSSFSVCRGQMSGGNILVPIVAHVVYDLLTFLEVHQRATAQLKTTLEGNLPQKAQVRA